MSSGPPSILIIEDDDAIAEAVGFHLDRAGMCTTVAADGLAGLRELRTSPPDALVLDLMLPHVDGWHIIREVRDWAPRLPVLVVTARTNDHDRVEALALGADDVMSKPFSMREMVARVAALLRRSALDAEATTKGMVTAGDMRIDVDHLSVTIGEAPIGITPLEFRLLWVLAERDGRVLSRDEIYRRVWEGERPHGDRSVDVLVRRLRRKVDEIPGRYTYIQTQHGVGYRFVATERLLPHPGPARRSMVSRRSG